MLLGQVISHGIELCQLVSEVEGEQGVLMPFDMTEKNLWRGYAGCHDRP